MLAIQMKDLRIRLINMGLRGTTLVSKLLK
jgi:hypothetical protein